MLFKDNTSTRTNGDILAAGAVKPGTSSSVEIFTADLLIPGPGLRVAFTFKPSLPASQLSLELWCWMEPSNSSSADTLTTSETAAKDVTAIHSEAPASESGARASELGATGNESVAQASESGGRGSGSGAKVLAMLQANGVVIITDEQTHGRTDKQAARPVADL